MNGLQARIRFQSSDSQLGSESRGLPRLVAQQATAGGTFGAGGADGDLTRANRVRQSSGSPHIAGPYGRFEPVLGAVCQGNGLRFGLELLHTKHRAEDLFPCDRHMTPDAVEDRRLDIASSGLLNLALQYRSSAVFETLLDISLDSISLCRTRQRPERGRFIERIARLVFPGPADHLLQQRLLDSLLNDEARSRRAHLPLVVEDALHSGIRHAIEIVDIPKDHLGGFASAFEQQRLAARARGELHDLTP